MGKYSHIDRGLKQKIEKLLETPGKTIVTTEEGFSIEVHEWFAKSAKVAKTIIFPAKQVEVFKELTNSYTENLDYKLPFNFVFLQFTEPVIFQLNDIGSDRLSCMLLTQIQDKENNSTINVAHVFMIMKNTDRYGIMSFGWQGESFPLFEKIQLRDDIAIARSIIIACIGYINCENVYLEKEGEVEEKVNRKREREGKKLLEPYYVCRIRGVKYDSEGRETIRDASGRHVSFRFDVRGHFRRYESGRTTWVRPHQRGLDKELYIPKTYVVPDPPEEKESEN